MGDKGRAIVGSGSTGILGRRGALRPARPAGGLRHCATAPLRAHFVCGKTSTNNRVDGAVMHSLWE